MKTQIQESKWIRSSQWTCKGTVRDLCISLAVQITGLHSRYSDVCPTNREKGSQWMWTESIILIINKVARPGTGCWLEFSIAISAVSTRLLWCRCLKSRLSFVSRLVQNFQSTHAHRTHLLFARTPPPLHAYIAISSRFHHHLLPSTT